MATEFFMPTLGMNQETGKIIEWLVGEGQDVSKGQPIMVVETDKSTVELEAPATGKLVNVTAKDGDEVPVGQVIALILKEGETVPEATMKFIPAPPAVATPVDKGSAAASLVTTVPLPATIKPASPLAARVAEENGIDLSQVPCSGKRIQKEDVLAYLAQLRAAVPARDGKVLASPKARRLAREHNIDLTGMPGRGPEGAVLAMDVMEAVAAQSVPVSSSGCRNSPSPGDAIRTYQPGVAGDGPAPDRELANYPHFYLEAEANASPLKAWREKLLERYQEKVTFTDLIVKLIAIALHRHPIVNSSWVNGSIQSNPEINIGLAVAVEDGLLVPVIRNADRLGIQALAMKRKNLVTGAQANRLGLPDLSGGTFTVSNLGMYGIDAFNAIINPPEAAILALGQIVEKVVPVHGQPVVQPRLRMVLSCDHRVVDGARGAQFLQTVVKLIEDPLTCIGLKANSKITKGARKQGCEHARTPVFGLAQGSGTPSIFGVY
jgi:pyruvate dehydrogenase E2 component (dihydrolipoamide acetyltransferase)